MCWGVDLATANTTGYKVTLGDVLLPGDAIGIGNGGAFSAPDLRLDGGFGPAQFAFLCRCIDAAKVGVLLAVTTDFVSHGRGLFKLLPVGDPVGDRV